VINRVHFENFKSLKNVSLELGRLTVLVGPNGCGKSSVLQGIRLLSDAGRPRPDEWLNTYRRFKGIFAGLRDPQRLASPGRPITIALSMRDSGGDQLQLEIFLPVIPPGTHPDNEAREFRVSVDGPEGTLAVGIPATLNQEKSSAEREREVLGHPRLLRFSGCAYLQLNATAMARTSVSEEVLPRMGANGSGLASALAWMKGAAEDELAHVTKDLQTIVPGVRRIRTLRELVPNRRIDRVDIDGQPVWRPVDEELLGDRFELEFDSGVSIPADLLSEGTVLVLGLLTKLYEPERPRLLLLDDIDRGLHIEAQANLVRALRDLQSRDPELQIVCTTHSPYLLDRFDPSEVRMLALNANRYTQALALTAHPDFEKWKFGTQTGELWAALGNAWVSAAPEQQT
jgi:predicted ATPase